jgi:hypothetical protein
MHLAMPPLLQIDIARKNSSMTTAKAMYGYPASATAYPYNPPGCYLHDVVNANFRFTDIFGPSAVKTSGFTHWDVLQNTRPNVNAPYTYDTIAARAKNVLSVTTAEAGIEPVASTAAMEAAPVPAQHSGTFADGDGISSSAAAAATAAVTSSITEGSR